MRSGDADSRPLSPASSGMAVNDMLAFLDGYLGTTINSHKGCHNLFPNSCNAHELSWV